MKELLGRKGAIPVLSVDWDYFFPNSEDFDWGHREETHVMLFLEVLWSMRWSNHTLDGKHLAHEYYKPREKWRSFWDNIITKDDGLMQLGITESHKDIIDFIAPVLEQQMKLDIYNFDAHHDAGYGEETTPLDCGNWAEHAKLMNPNAQYTLIYPKWRIETPEKGMSNGNRPAAVDQVFYCVPKIPPPLFIFICRSGAWTPPWSDPQWLDFIEWWERHRNFTWNVKSHNEYSLKQRPFDIETARKFYREKMEVLARHHKGGKK